jgi:hypothetical protein
MIYIIYLAVGELGFGQSFGVSSIRSAGTYSGKLMMSCLSSLHTIDAGIWQATLLSNLHRERHEGLSHL